MSETATDMKIEILKEGKGKTPQLGDTVLIHYILNLGTGVSSSNYDYDKHCYVDELVDSTYEEPLARPIPIILGAETPKDGLYKEGDSIKGLDEALSQVKVGSKCKLLIPSEMAYGWEGASSFHTFHGYRTPPHRSLDMVVELLEIQDISGENK